MSKQKREKKSKQKKNPRKSGKFKITKKLLKFHFSCAIIVKHQKMLLLV